MRQLLIGKSGTLNYASSKTNSAVNTATTPDLLADGAIGIYAKLNNGTTTVLVTTSNVGTYTVTSTDIVIAQGTATGAYIGEKQKLSEISRVFGKENEIGRNLIAFIGYDGASGTLNLGSIGNTDTGIIDFSGKKSLVGVQEYQNTYDTGRLFTSSTGYDVVSQLCTVVNADTFNAWAILDVTANGTFGVITGTGSMVFTKGSTTITTTTHNVLAGDYLSINNTRYTGTTPSVVYNNNITAPTTGATGIVYKVVSVTTTTIVLDRPYTGETQTITAGNVTSIWVGKTTTAPSQYGLKVVGGLVYEQLYLAVGGIIQYATINYVSGSFPGSGTTADIKKLEFDSQIGQGFLNTVDGYLPRPVSRVDTSKVYDKYFVDTRYKSLPNFMDGKVHDAYTIIVAFESGSNNTAGLNEKDFDTIITTLYPTITSDVILTA